MRQAATNGAVTVAVGGLLVREGCYDLVVENDRTGSFTSVTLTDTQMWELISGLESLRNSAVPTVRQQLRTFEH